MNLKVKNVFRQIIPNSDVFYLKIDLTYVVKFIFRLSV